MGESIGADEASLSHKEAVPTWGTRALQAGKQRSRLRGLIQGSSRNEDHVRGREVV